MYLDLMEACLTGMIYRDASYNTFGQEYDNDKRLIGGDWPMTAHTMIGVKRLHQLRRACEDVIYNGVPGNFIECGVWRGGACIMMKAVADSLVKIGCPRIVYCADSFKGFPAFTHSVDRELTESFGSDDLNFLSVPLEKVKDNFAAYGLLDSRVEFIEGYFHESLPRFPTGPLAILRCDGDLYSSTMDILINLYHKLSPRGYCIIDDYGAMHQCRRAVDDFRKTNSIKNEIIDIDGSGVYWIK